MRHQRVGDVMTTDVVTVDTDARFKDIVQRMADTKVTAVPVVDPTGHVAGIITETDLLRKIEFSEEEAIRPLFERRGARIAREKAEAVQATELMTTPAVTISPDAKIITAARQMSHKGLRRLVVTDEYGALLGVVSRGDLLGVFTRDDAAIAADIRDQVIRRAMSIDPDTMDVTVTDGVAELDGQVERRSSVAIMTELTRAVDGVVDVTPRVRYQVDDTAPTVYAGM